MKRYKPLAVCVVIALCVGSVASTYTSIISASSCTDLQAKVVKPVIIPEDTTVGTILIEAKVHQLDVTSSPANAFRETQLNSSAVAIELGQTFDFEHNQGGPITINVVCHNKDIGQTSNLRISVIIKDVNEGPPTFNITSLSVNITEDTAPNTDVYQLQGGPGEAVDPDYNGISQGFEYSITKVTPSSAAGLFVVENTLDGSIQLKKPLDFETGPTTITLEIIATETSSAEKLVSSPAAKLTIHVGDVDDQGPVFGAPSYTLQLDEGEHTDKTYATSPVLSAHDGDTLNTEIKFTMSKTNSPQIKHVFDVAADGKLIVNGSLTPGVYSILVKAYQVNDPDFRFDVAPVIVTVIDVNDHSPVMGQVDYTATMSEASLVGSLAVTVTASDLDQGKNAAFEFKISNGAGLPFSISTSGNNGIITTKTSLDREAKGVYTFVVYAQETQSTEKHKSNDSIVTITITDVNDNAPMFYSSNYSMSVQRIAIGGQLIGTVNAVDADAGANGQVTYSLQPSAFSPALTIGAASGRITVGRDLTPNDVGVHDMIVIASDNCTDVSLRRSTQVDLHVTVQAVNTRAPIFDQSEYKFTVPEGAPVGEVLGRLMASDPDHGDVVTVTMGASQGYLRLINVSALLLNKEVDLDPANAPQSIMATAVATDGVHNTTVNITLSFQHVNEFPPVLTAPRLVYINESDTKGTLVAQVTATDNDSGTDGNVTFTLLGGNSSMFTIDGHTGLVTLTCDACLDYSMRRHYDLVVMAADGGVPARSTSQSIGVDILETVFSPPAFLMAEFVISVRENQPVGTFLIQLEATDPDTPEQNLTYSLASTSSKVALLVNGSVHTIQKLDAEAIQNPLVVVVTVTDGHGSDTANLTIVIADTNDNSPVINVTATTPAFAVMENATVGEVITAVGASDKDISNHGFTFWITEGGDGKFTIDADTGVISVIAPVDRRTQQRYNLTVAVSDHGQPPLDASTNVIIEVTDSNTRPAFVDGTTSPVDAFVVRVQENTTVGDSVITLTAQDPDQGSSGKLTFSIQSGNADGTFDLDPDSGVITLAKGLNFETKENYSLTVKVQDQSLNSLFSTAKLYIEVTNVVEAPQWPHLPTVYLTHSDTCADNTQIQAFSREVTSLTSRGDEAVEYSIRNTSSDFSIDADSGLLKMDKRVQEGTYNILLAACSKGTTVCSEQILTVVVQSEKILAFCPAFYSTNVSEATQPGAAPHRVLVQELHTTKGNDSIVFAISGGNDGLKFTIDSQTGRIYLSKELDRETTARYTLQVTATDNIGKTVEAQVNIIVTDADDTPPEFATPTYAGQLREDAVIGAPVLELGTSTALVLEATDKDEASQLTYSIIPGFDNSNGTFDIDNAGVITLVKSVDFETMGPASGHVYTLMVEASDGTMTSNTTVTITIQDANDNDPVFDDLAYNLNVSELTSAPKVLLTVVATDGDDLDQGRLTYSISLIEPQGEVNPFSVSQSGEVTLERQLDRETVPEYFLGMVVTDAAGHHGRANLTITVMDENDNAPQFNQTDYQMNVTEGLTLVISPPYVIAGRSPHLLVNCTFDHPLTGATNLMSLVVSVAGADQHDFTDLVSISAFNPDQLFREPGLHLASASGFINDDVTKTSFLTLEWDFPDAREHVYKCEANGQDRHGHSVTYESKIKVHPAGQLSASHLIRELQKLGSKNKDIEKTNVNLKKELFTLRDHVFGASMRFDNKTYYLAKCPAPSADQSTELCSAVGGKLAQVTSDEEYVRVKQFLAGNILNDTRVFISGTDRYRWGYWVDLHDQADLPLVDWAEPDVVLMNPDAGHCMALGRYIDEVKMFPIPCVTDSSSDVGVTFLCEVPDA